MSSVDDAAHAEEVYSVRVNFLRCLNKCTYEVNSVVFDIVLKCLNESLEKKY